MIIVSLSTANETLLACDSYVNKYVKDLQLFWNRLRTARGNGVTGVFAAWNHQSFEGMSRKLKLVSRFATLLWKCTCKARREAEMLAVRLQFSQEGDGEGDRQASGKSLRRVFAGDCSHQDREGIWPQSFPGSGWRDRWVGRTSCLCSFVRSANPAVTWPNSVLLA